MRKIICFVFLIFTFASPLGAQVILPDFLVNNPAQNTLGIGPTAIAVAPNGNIGVAWQDWNSYGTPTPANPRVAVQLFAPNTATIGPLNLFNGESRSTIIYQDDYLTGDIDLEFMPNNVLLVAVEHEGLYDNFTNWTWSYESGIGAMTAAGLPIDMLNGSTGIILWYWANDLVDNGNMRLAMTPAGNFLGTVNGPSYNTDMHAVLIQQYDANANLAGPYFTPHINDPGPNHNHILPDIGTNGAVHLVVWQDGRQDANYDISAQFYDNASAIGGNQKVNVGDPQGTFNLLPSLSMNPSGNSVVVWVDTRQGTNGEIFGQLYNSAAQAVGGNFQISTGQGAIPWYQRPEVAMRDNGSFMVVWTDSIPGISGLQAYRARFRQFDANANPTGPASVLPQLDIASGYPCVATNGIYYYCSWIDARVNPTMPNVYMKVVDNAYVGVEEIVGNGPHDSFHLSGNFPNPFKSETSIQFSIPVSSQVTIKVFDITGKEIATVVDETLQAGEYKHLFNGSDLTEGIYFYKMKAVGTSGLSSDYYSDAKRFVVIR